jgi:hypothetical protein
MQSITFKTTNGTELELRNIPNAATVDFVQAAVVLLEAVEDAVITDSFPEGTLYSELLGGSAGLAIIGMNHEVDTENEDVDYTDDIENEESQAGQEQQVETAVEKEEVLDPEIVKLMNDVVNTVVKLRVTVVKDDNYNYWTVNVDGNEERAFLEEDKAEAYKSVVVDKLVKEAVGKCDECGEVHPFPTRATN